jgi:hypothetical protein
MEPRCPEHSTHPGQDLEPSSCGLAFLDLMYLYTTRLFGVLACKDWRWYVRWIIDQGDQSLFVCYAHWCRQSSVPVLLKLCFCIAASTGPELHFPYCPGHVN